MTSRLSKADVARLLADPTPEARVDTATKVAAEFGGQKLKDNEREIAKQIFRVMVKDAEVRVREALSVHLKLSPDLPHDVALSLAKDVDSVALPMLSFSEVLTDDDLIEIVRGPSAAKQVAVAQRPRVSSQVAGALIDTRNEVAVARLVANEGAELDEGSLGRVMKEYEENEEISDILVRRPDLPAALSEQLVNALSRKIESYLVEKHDLPADAAATLILQVRERATMSLLSEGSSDDELERLVEQLQVNGRLTPSLVLRALCMGDMNFFEAAMARLASIPVQNARILIHDKGTLGLESIYLRAGMPERLFMAVQAGVEVANETQYDGGENDRQRYVERMLERILTQWEDPSERIGEDDIEYLMNKLQQLAA
ncbi:MAG: DUF2336 domain-containing protein [Rhodospirillales bacterium]|nr:DUF2336 domain-containing protein [Rhodospirillales bacterium]MDH3792336.1 DUF2336 domain-containing protein [Rhodospirillales bacterium]MDH3910205.1 DUF2336 domain-containing protein [Rhodospirillales bacterium]MDH3917283.1 DUF2336 domain-containing protein [Rhodospirillales bacterium]MDH3966330.1 DUF2336 domain-containing protein [Rhodospirillales bacterium]